MDFPINKELSAFVGNMAGVVIVSSSHYQLLYFLPSLGFEDDPANLNFASIDAAVGLGGGINS